MSGSPDLVVASALAMAVSIKIVILYLQNYDHAGGSVLSL